MTISTIQNDLQEASTVLQRFISDENNLKAIEAAAEIMIDCLKKGGKIISCGNGGSHCDAMHFAEELTGKYREDREPFAAIAISEPGYLTCTGNDYGYNQVFSRYVKGVGRAGDVLLAISTSGNSENVIEAAKMAHQKQMKVVSLTGKDGGKLMPLSDVCVNVVHAGFADRVQEVHIKVIHIFMRLIEKAFNY
jgi:D-sedoheptulose 7-phosphate isomerase